MSSKQMVGLILLSLGVVLIVLSLNRLGYIPEKRQELKIITDSPISPTERLPEAHVVITVGPERNHGVIFFVMGAVLVVVGAVVALRYKR